MMTILAGFGTIAVCVLGQCRLTRCRRLAHVRLHQSLMGMIIDILQSVECYNVGIESRRVVVTVG
jgi:hypothetical protein